MARQFRIKEEDANGRWEAGEIGTELINDSSKFDIKLDLGDGREGYFYADGLEALSA